MILNPYRSPTYSDGYANRAASHVRPRRATLGLILLFAGLLFIGIGVRILLLTRNDRSRADAALVAYRLETLSLPVMICGGGLIGVGTIVIWRGGEWTAVEAEQEKEQEKVSGTNGT